MPDAASGSRVFTIPAGAPFVDDLAVGLIARFGGAPEALARITVLLPTRRGARALRDAFLRVREGRACLLPAIRAIGDVELDDVLLNELPSPPDLAPPMAPLRRQYLLAELVMRFAPMPRAQAMAMAADLAGLLDHLAIEEVPLSALDTIVPDALAAHWQKTREFLSLIEQPWRDILAAEGRSDPGAHRIAMIHAYAEAIAAQAAAPRNPDSRRGPIVAAGSTGSVPATAALMAAIAAHPAGLVVLPGLDRAAPDEVWAALDESHPQFGMKHLLAGIGIARAAVAPWSADRADSPRQALLRETMRPAAISDTWQALGPWPDQALDRLARIDCPAPREEAAVIAVAMRETLETPGRTVALMTPDRGLARRVASELARWGIEADDSDGEALSATPVGAFLRLTAELGRDDLAPADLLAVLKHPLARAGREARELRRWAERLELAVLRGPRPGPGIAGLEAAVAELETDGLLGPIWNDLRPPLAAWLDMLERAECEAPAMLRAQIALAEALAGDADGASGLWSGDAGEVAAALIDDLDQAMQGLPPIAGRDYPALLAQALADSVVRPRFGRHPRVFIWGPLEARLQQADRLILGGLNEGTWPRLPGQDGWLNRPMRQELGLPTPERRIGLSAHDFAQSLAAGDVLLTRSERVEGAPTVPSRWLVRLDTVLGPAGQARIRAQAASRLAWARALDAPAAVEPIAAPSPRPPLAARPNSLSVTRIETWLRNPYAIYVERILKLRPLDPLDADPNAADKGTAVHAALDRFVKSWRGNMSEAALDHLLDLGREAFGPLLRRPVVRVLWWPRFEALARWFIEEEQKKPAGKRILATEVKGKMIVPASVPPFTVTGTADRIDRAANGGIEIIDYKTGTVPRKSQIESGIAVQLVLEAAMVAAGAFDALEAPGPVTAISYWRLSGDRDGGQVRTYGDGGHRLERPIVEMADDLVARLARWVRDYRDPDTAYLARPRPAFAPLYDDYEHLARIGAWPLETS